MARRNRFAQAQFALWPDEGLQAAAATLIGLPVIYRAELSFRGNVDLTVDFSDNDYASPDDPSATTGEGRHHRMLSLEWGGVWEDGGYRSNRVFALESYEEFYAGPFGTYHPSRQGVPPSYFYEVVNEPNPWIAEILEENDNTDVFPPSGLPVMDEQGWHGRFFSPHATLGSSGTQADFCVISPFPQSPAEKAAAVADFRAKQQVHWEAQKRRPRYRHLFIVSESHTLEILCEDLPRWRWVGPEPTEQT